MKIIFSIFINSKGPLMSESETTWAHFRACWERTSFGRGSVQFDSHVSFVTFGAKSIGFHVCGHWTADRVVDA